MSRQPNQVPKAHDGGDLFPRKEHPDTRTAATWLKQLADLQRRKYPKNSRWYPDKERGGKRAPGAGRPTEAQRVFRKKYDWK